MSCLPIDFQIENRLRRQELLITPYIPSFTNPITTTASQHTRHEAMLASSREASPSFKA
jgi:hypothetical protein